VVIALRRNENKILDSDLIDAMAKELSLMSPDSYQQACLRTESLDQYDTMRSRLSVNPQLPRMLHGLIGMMTEIGEMADNIKRHLFYGSDLKMTGKDSMTEECGDEMWYVALMADAIQKNGGEGLAKMLELNIAKLKARYPGKFTPENALNRDVDKENEALGGETKAV
jgi:NTP pyrophosphatase (non-canonical NTP hydrolase)